jgi:hypothetical protein
LSGVFTAIEARSTLAHVSTERHSGVLIWVGLACIVPTTLFYLYSQGSLTITPINLLGVVLLTLGLVRRGRYTPNEEVPSPGEAHRTESPQRLSPPPSADD